MFANDVTLTAGNEALVGGIEGGLLVGLDDLAVRAQRHVLPGAEGRRIVLRLPGYGLSGHVDPLGARCTGAAAGSRPIRAGAAGSATAAAPAAGPIAIAGAGAVAIPGAIATPVP